ASAAKPAPARATARGTAARRPSAAGATGAKAAAAVTAAATGAEPTAGTPTAAAAAAPARGRGSVRPHPEAREIRLAVRGPRRRRVHDDVAVRIARRLRI